MILVFGKTGQVATELARQPNVIALGREQVDLIDAEACASAIHAHKPMFVINAAAYTAVDKAEEEVNSATLINGIAPTAMAHACAELDVPFVHISTDYVFDGAGEEAFKTDAATNPLGVYGLSKLKGEEGVRAAGGTYAILRTSWVFSEHGNNFLKTMLRLGADRSELHIVADQIGGPTPANAIASACLSIGMKLLNAPMLSGTYHFSGAPNVSWAGFAKEIFTVAGFETTVLEIPSSDFPTPAARPANSRLDCMTSLEAFGIYRPDWRTDLNRVINFLKDD